MTPPNTAVLLVDPYNDFLHPHGKAYARVAESLAATSAVAHMQSWLEAYERVDDKDLNGVVFEEGSWGAEIHKGLEPVLGNGDVVVGKHWNSSGFANTDLDYQLRQRDITHLIVAGTVANTCVESTARYARELGFHVTLLTDATAGFSTAAKDAAVQLIWPLIAEEVMTVHKWIASLKSEEIVKREGVTVKSKA